MRRAWGRAVPACGFWGGGLFQEHTFFWVECEHLLTARLGKHFYSKDPGVGHTPLSTPRQDEAVCHPR